MIKIEVNTNDALMIADTVFSDTVSDSVKHRTVEFLFAPRWDGYQKTAVFSADDVEPINIVLNSDSELCVAENQCYIPFEVLKGDRFYVSVFGVKGESLATTTKIAIDVLESGYALGDTPSEPTPDEYQQIIEIMSKTQEIAQSVREDADNGVFDGKQGVDGKDAITDLVYNPESENAQSGKAVAQAMDGAVTSERVRDSIEGTTFIFNGGNAIDNCMIDSEMSNSSENAVQNKVVKSYVDTEILNVRSETKQDIFPIGSIWIGGKNERPIFDLETGNIISPAGPINPSTMFGGEWELFDKEFACVSGSLDIANDLISYNSTQIKEVLYVRAGHTLRIRIQVSTGVAIDDNNVELMKIVDMDTLGITAWDYNFYNVAASSDSGNAWLSVNLHSDGRFEVIDIIKKSSTNEHIFDAGKTIFFDVSTPICSKYMLDDFCDKFYWRRIG